MLRAPTIGTVGVIPCVGSIGAMPCIRCPDDMWCRGAVDVKEEAVVVVGNGKEVGCGCGVGSELGTLVGVGLRGVVKYVKRNSIHRMQKRHMGWLRLVGSIKLQVSFAEYSLFYRALLQKRPINLRSLPVVATPYNSERIALAGAGLGCVAVCCSVLQCVAVCCIVLRCVAPAGVGLRCGQLFQQRPV